MIMVLILFTLVCPLSKKGRLSRGWLIQGQRRLKGLVKFMGRFLEGGEGDCGGDEDADEYGDEFTYRFETGLIRLFLPGILFERKLG